MAFSEMDINFVRAIRYLHSTSSESQANLRALLDEAIKSKYGPSKDIGPYLNSSLAFQEFPVLAASQGSTVGSGSETQSQSQSESGRNSELTESQVSRCGRGEEKICSSSDNELELDLLKEDLMCVICNGMGVGARNRLVECCDCHCLYHQECHDPSISEEEMETSAATWMCASCKGKTAMVTSPTSTQPSPSAAMLRSPASYKSFTDKEYPETKTLSQSSSNSSSYSNSNSNSSNNSSNSTSPNTKSPVANVSPTASAARIVTPNINIISADKRLQIMKKKAAKLQEKRKLSR